MNLFLIGASGMIGAPILAEAAKRGHAVTAAARHPENIATLPGVTARAVDATDADALIAAADGAQVILSATSPRFSGDATADAAALGDALVAAGKVTGLPIVMVGGAGTLSLPDGSPVMDLLPPEIKPEAMGIRAIKDALDTAGLDWTYVAPSAEIAPGARTGTFRVGGTTLLTDADGKSAISAEDFAIAFVDEVETRAHKGQVFTVGY
ncbi:NAD(P)-dependent oxidoreductase [Actibacterium ureilyticum]|uniref:NAD(P)-dependent oxidoreductase n=1 Tax=Actibacterium ureilyticum TaxID=1590614 RepID=UPI0015960A85|nr:NAD(P)H-binding protein [Actibacterium ureilyticum]